MDGYAELLIDCTIPSVLESKLVSSARNRGVGSGAGGRAPTLFRLVEYVLPQPPPLWSRGPCLELLALLSPSPPTPFLSWLLPLLTPSSHCSNAFFYYMGPLRERSQMMSPPEGRDGGSKGDGVWS